MKRKSSNSYLTSIQTFLERGWVALKKLNFANAIEMKITFLSKKKKCLCSVVLPQTTSPSPHHIGFAELLVSP